MNSPSTSKDTVYGILAIVAAVFSLSLGDAVIKLFSLSLPLWQIFILRSSIALPILFALILRRRTLHFESLYWVTVRSVLLVFMWLSYYASLPLMSLSLAAAAFYTSPILITVIVAMVAKKRPGFMTWTAMVLGFFGILLILRPDASEFQMMTALPVLAALLYASAMVLTSIKCGKDDPIALAVALNIAFIISDAAIGLFAGSSMEESFLLGSWVPLDGQLLGVVAALAIAIIVGSVGAAIAYQKGPPATIATFDYSYLIFSLVWGIVFFAELPDRLSLAGIVVIIVAGFLAIVAPKRP